MDKVAINPKSPIYDVYSYHGCKEECGIQGTPIILKVKTYDDEDDVFKEIQKTSFSKRMKKNVDKHAGKLVR